MINFFKGLFSKPETSPLEEPEGLPEDLKTSNLVNADMIKEVHEKSDSHTYSSSDVIISLDHKDIGSIQGFYVSGGTEQKGCFSYIIINKKDLLVPYKGKKTRLIVRTIDAEELFNADIKFELNESLSIDVECSLVKHKLKFDVIKKYSKKIKKEE